MQASVLGLLDFPEGFNKLVQTNIISIFNVSQCVAKFMIKREKGKIINIAGVQTTGKTRGAPTASKGAVKFYKRNGNRLGNGLQYVQ